jgi:hypothetical protein
MTHFVRATFGVSVLGVLMVSSSLSANALTVGRCNSLVDGIYVPVLLVQNGDAKSVHRIGSDGLTRGIIYNPDAALSWAVQDFGVAESDAEYSDACHAVIEGNAPPPLPVLIEEEEEEEEEEDDDDDDYGGEVDGEVFF